MAISTSPMLESVVDLFVRLDAWLSALIFASLMLSGWWFGCRHRLTVTRKGADASNPPLSTRMEDAGLALFGLLLAFCFAGAATRYEARKQVLLDDAMAIGGLATVASLLQEPDRSSLQREIRAYVAQRLVFGTTPLEDPKMPGLINQARAHHARMTTLVSGAIARNNTPSVHASLVTALNGVMDAADRRLQRVREHVPESIVLMLVVFGVFAAYTMGWLRDTQRAVVEDLPRIMAYVTLVGLVFFVTIDLEQPRRGLLRVSQAPMEELRSSLALPPAR